MTTPQLTLVDRYVMAVLDEIPVPRRADIERELRTSIADAVEARVEAGADPTHADVQVLTDLGDPARLAAGYVERPLHLIGPAFYLDYVRLLRVLMWTVLPITGIVSIAVNIVRHQPVVPAIFGAVGTVANTAVWMFFWVTILFVVLERVAGVKTPLAGPWTPKMLVDPAGRAFTAAPTGPWRSVTLAAYAAWVALLITALIEAPRISPLHDSAGAPINVLDPWLWKSHVVYVIVALMVAGLAVAAVDIYAKRRPSVAWWIVATLFDIAWPAGLIWLTLADRLVDPAFVQAAGWQADVTRWVHASVIVFALYSAGHAIVARVVRSRRLTPR